MATLKVKPTQDGTDTVHEGQQLLASDLTRTQAEACLAQRAEREPAAVRGYA